MTDLPVQAPTTDAEGWLSDDPAPTNGRVFETVFQDNGDIVEWSPGTGSKRDGTWKHGTIMEGIFVGAEMIELSEEDRLNSADPDKTHAALLVFEDEYGDRWSTWETYQMKPEKFTAGDTYVIECQRERKTDKGHMKSFKIQRELRHADPAS